MGKKTAAVTSKTKAQKPSNQQTTAKHRGVFEISLQMHVHAGDSESAKKCQMTLSASLDKDEVLFKLGASQKAQFTLHREEVRALRAALDAAQKVSFAGSEEYMPKLNFLAGLLRGRELEEGIRVTLDKKQICLTFVGKKETKSGQQKVEAHAEPAVYEMHKLMAALECFGNLYATAKAATKEPCEPVAVGETHEA